MSMLSISLWIFVILELANILFLYFAPTSKNANSTGVFKALEASKEYPEIHDFIKYLINWVAGAKIIFILGFIVVLLTADEVVLFYTGASLVLAMSTFYFRLFPLVRKMDKNGQIDPKGYSIALGVMIATFMLIFIIGIILNKPDSITF